MLFQSPEFLVFISIFAVVYFVTRKHLHVQNAVILCSSYVFYGAWDYRFLVLILASTATDYISGIGAGGQKVTNRHLAISLGWFLLGSILVFTPTINDSADFLAICFAYSLALWFLSWIFSLIANEQERSRAYLILSLVCNLGLLGIFKYFNFFAESLNSLVGRAGFEIGWTTYHIILPVGISFYTFQTLSYTIDAYRRKIKPDENFLAVAAFIAFFPQLVAGPIERATNLLQQFHSPRTFTATAFKTGVVLFMWGLFKKVVIADNLAVLSEHSFGNTTELDSALLLIGLLAFTFQLYCDFSGYSDMARGLARMMGFSLMLNFNIPYLCRTPSEHWEKWHISLSTWLRDYLYISLGGNRGTVIKTYRNLMLTMVLGGLWHGANWTYILWGTLHGFILIAYRLIDVDGWLSRRENSLAVRRFQDFILYSLMFVIIVFSHLIFRSHDVSHIGVYLQGIAELDRFATWAWFDLLRLIAPLLLVQCIQLYYKELEVYWRVPVWLRINLTLMVIYGVFLMPRGAAQEFIYFDF